MGDNGKLVCEFNIECIEVIEDSEGCNKCSTKEEEEEDEEETLHNLDSTITATIWWGRALVQSLHLFASFVPERRDNQFN